MSMVLAAARMRRALQDSDRVVRLLEKSRANLDNGSVFQQMIDVVDREAKAMAPMISAWVQQNYAATGLGKWENHDKGLMQKEIAKGVVSFRYLTKGKKAGQGWYIRFNLRPDATHYTNADGKKRSIFQVAHALSFGAVHVKGDSHLVGKSTYNPDTGIYRSKHRVAGTKEKRTIKAAALKAKALGVSGRLFDYMTFKQKMAFLYNSGGHEPVLRKRRSTFKRPGITVDVQGTGARMVVLPPRPWLKISETQKAMVLSRVFKSIKSAMQKGEIHGR